MPKILITGNGFDLHFGLPTLYSDFIKIVSSIITNQDKIEFNKVYSVCKNHEIIIENFTSFKFDLGKIKVLKELSINNLWLIFFKK